MIERIDGTKVLCYPNLIRRLCERAGVDIRSFTHGDTVQMNPPLPLPVLGNIGPLNLDIQPPPAPQYVRRPPQRRPAQRRPRPAESHAPLVTKRRRTQTVEQEESSAQERTHTEEITPRVRVHEPQLNQQ